MDRAAREALATRAIALANGMAAEALVFDEDASLTRFTQNAIHQNVAERNTRLRVRTIARGRTGVAETNALDDESLRALIERSREIGTFAPRDDGGAPLVAHASVPAARGAYSAATAGATPQQRAEVVADIARAAERGGYWAAGYVRTSRGGVTLANTSGALVSFDGTECALNVKANAPDSSGYAEAYATDFAALDGARAGELATRKARDSAAPVAVEPGAWTVILEPAAFGELFSYLADHFSAQAYDEGSSFLTGTLDTPCAATSLTLHDDFAHPLLCGMPFDFEGYPKLRVPLIENGVARGIVTDAMWAQRLGRPNTGHGQPAPSASGPQAQHLVVAPGTKSVEQLIAETERGLLVTRFWYIRPVDHRKTIVTGMTRDGMFLIERGALGRGVRNMRFNQSILAALHAAEFARQQTRTAGFAYTNVVPAVKFEKFTFTSVAEF